MKQSYFGRLRKLINELDECARAQAMSGGGDPVDIPLHDKRYEAVRRRIDECLQDMEVLYKRIGE